MRTIKVNIFRTCFVLAGSALLLQACGSDPGDPFSVNVRNNTTQAVVLRACNGYSPGCKSFAYEATINPESSRSTVQEFDGTSRPIMVTTSQGAILGCLPFKFSKQPSSKLTVEVTRMVPCGRDLGMNVAHGQNWP